MENFDSEQFEQYLIDLIKKDTHKARSIDKKGIPLAAIDPFSALFESMTHGISFQEWIDIYESRRIRQKTLQNNIGKLHEIAVSCFDGWFISDSTADVENTSQSIIAEIKNKYNTMNSSSALATYNKLVQLVDGKYEGFTSYIVQIIPKPNSNPYRHPFTPSDSSKKKAKKCPERDDVLVIDGQSFYAIVNNGDPDTLKNLYLLTADLLAKHLGNKASNAYTDELKEQFIEAVLPSNR